MGLRDLSQEFDLKHIWEDLRGWRSRRGVRGSESLLSLPAVDKSDLARKSTIPNEPLEWWMDRGCIARSSENCLCLAATSAGSLSTFWLRAWGLS